MRYSIIGAGAAGLAAVRSIRKEEPTADITVISADPAPFYFRPMLVELFNRDHFAHDVSKPPAVLENITWKLGTKVASIDPKAKKLLLVNGEAIDYDFLVIASGSKPDVSFVEPFVRYIHTVHSNADLLRLKKTLGLGRVLVIGGGYVSIEVIRQLHNRGNLVDFFARADLFWPREVPGVSANDIEAILKSVDIPPQFGVEVVDVVDIDGTLLAVVDSQGRTQKYESIIVVPAEVPDIDFIVKSGIHCQEGVIVNEELRTNIPNIFACGDCAQVLDLKRQINRINFGWRSAEKQGEIAGQNVVGKSTVYVPNSEDFYFLDLLGKNLLDRWAANPSGNESDIK